MPGIVTRMDGQRLPVRKSMRLKGYYYSTAGVYFLTICTYRKRCTLGDVVDARFVPSPLGKIATSEWQRLARNWPTVTVLEFVVMPNHVHALVEIPGGSPSIAALVTRYKAACARRHLAMACVSREPVWQRGYHDRVVRNDRELRGCWGYIQENPRLWEEERDRPESFGPTLDTDDSTPDQG
jgi:putative transposase